MRRPAHRARPRRVSSCNPVETAGKIPKTKADGGYYRNREQTDELFDGRWLNTGDKGGIFDGELYLSGRNKDLMAHAGRNIYPGEIEEAVGALEGVRAGCVAAFASGMGQVGGKADRCDGNARRRQE